MSRRLMAVPLVWLLMGWNAAAADCGGPPSAAESGLIIAQQPPAETIACPLKQTLDASGLDIHALLIIQDHVLKFEHYGSGADQPWGEKPGTYRYGMGDIHDIRSVSKSVVSLLVGIAVDRKLIAGIDQPIFDYLPEYRDLATPQKSKITIRHLLTMTSGLVTNEGLPYGDPNNTERLMAISADPYRFVLERNLMTEPGTSWAYSGGSTMLLSKILQHASGQSLLDFAEQNLFGPLSIRPYRWIGLKASGETAAYGSLKLRPRDMAKIGQLVLDGGAWEGKQIVSRAWIDQSTAPVIDAWYPDKYAMHWYRGDVPAGGRTTPVVYALGIGGQRIFVLPDLKTTVVVTAGLYDDGAQLKRFRTLLTDVVIPASERMRAANSP